jgi:hypothetical protein
MHEQQMVPIVYIGHKDYKTDNVNHTKTVWNKPGDVQPYPLNLAAALLRFQDVWKLGKASDLVGAAVVDDLIGVLAAEEQPKQPRSMREEAAGGPEALVKPPSARTLE